VFKGIALCQLNLRLCRTASQIRSSSHASNPIYKLRRNVLWTE